jgi:hypothetical protein
MEENGIIPYVNSIFQQPWWLDAVAPGCWNAVEIGKEGEITARLPYVVKKRYGLTILGMPQLTQTLGPWIKSSELLPHKQLALQKELFTEIIEQLPPHDYFNQNFHYSFTNWLPFYWKGFQQTTRYTYVIEDLSDHDRIWSGFKDKTRSEVRKAEKKVVCRSGDEIEKFLDINTITFERQGLKPQYSREFVRRLDEACAKHNARHIFFAEDAQGRLHAAVYIIWDNSSAYYLMGGADPELRSSGANSLLMWEAIKFASGVTKQFDFEGSMLMNVEQFFRTFGGAQKAYFQILHMNKGMRMLMSAHDFMRAALNRP